MLNFSSNKTKFIIILALFTSFAFQGDFEMFNFYLYSNRIYYPGSPKTSIQFSGGDNSPGVLMLRAYKVNNPVEFFQMQDNPHTPQFKDLTPANFISMIKNGKLKAKRDLGYMSNEFLSPSTKEIIQEVVDYRGTELKAISTSDNAVNTANKKNIRRNKQKSKSSKNKNTSNAQADDPILNNKIGTNKIAKNMVMPPPPKDAEGFPVVKEWKHNLAKTLDSYRDETIPVPITEQGVYVIEAFMRGKTHRTLLIISEYTGLLKQHGKKVLVYVANQVTGEKVSGFPVSFLENKIEIYKDKTGSNGVLKCDLPYIKSEQNPDSYASSETRVALGELNGNFIICDQQSYSYFSEDNSNSITYIQTDRPIYRPAQTVFYRALLRKKNEDGAYKKPDANDTIMVEIADSKNNIIKKSALLTNEFGSVNDSINLQEEAATGNYYIKLTYQNNIEYQNFTVEEYKKPEYKVEVIANKKRYTRGDTIKATVKANYFFGSPVSSGKVNYFIYSKPYREPWYAGTEWEYLYQNNDDDLYYTYRSKLLYSGNADIGSDGTYQINFPTSTNLDDGYTYRIKASVEDNSRRSIEGSTSVIVHYSDFYINSRTDKFIYNKKDNLVLTTAVKDYEANRFITTDLKATISKVTWKKIPAKSKYDYPKFEPIYSNIWSTNLTSNSNEETILKVPELNNSGYFRLELTGKDKNGTIVTNTNNFYIGSQDFSDNEDNYGSGSLKIISDKNTYLPGETIDALIVSPAPKVDVLLTSEGETIYDYAVERFNDNSQIVHINTNELLIPNFILEANLIVNGKVYSGSKNISIIPENKLIKIDIQTDKRKYTPGEKATITIKTINNKNEPCANAEVALGLVDEAVYSIAPDITPNLQRYFYATRYSKVNTTNSNYFSFYNEFTDLTPKNNDFFGFAANNIQQKIYLGDVKSNTFIQPALRKDFRDLAYWKPDIVTDNNGIAKINLTMPDNLTSWRISARAIDKNSAVGQKFSNALVRKELIVRMETPRFLNNGDELEIAVNVHNYLLTDKEVKIQLMGENILTAQKDTLVKINSDSEKRIDWKVKTKGIGNIKLIAKALTNEESDAMEMNIPIMPVGLTISNGVSTEMQSGISNQTMKLNVPIKAENPVAYINLTPSLAGGLLGSLNSLIGYPYGCVEQTMSRFLPAVMVAGNIEKLSIPIEPKFKNQLPRIVQKGLNRIYQFQHDDGAWGWWENDESHPFMTAYVMYGLAMARRYGYNVSDDVYEKGITGMTKFYSGEIEGFVYAPNGKKIKVKTRIDATTMAYISFVASVVNIDKPMKDKSLKLCNSLSRNDTLNNYTKALLALAYKNFGEKTLANNFATQLISSANNSNDLAYWNGKNFDYNWQDDKIETTAMVIRALLETQGITPLTSNAIRWLLTQRGEFGWGNTRQTSMVIYSLSDYLSQTNEVNPNYDLKVSVNGQSVLSKKITPQDVYKSEERLIIKSNILKQGDNIITIEKIGSGKLYASGIISYISNSSDITSGGAGFKVEREYYTLKTLKLKTKNLKSDSIIYDKIPYNGVVKSGDEIFVRVKITAPRDYDYIMLEEPIAAGCEIIRKTNEYRIVNEIEYVVSDFSMWNKWYSSRDIRDEKIAFFANSISSGTHEITYIMRAQIPGKYNIIPSKVCLMYYPEISGNSKSEQMRILN